MSTITHLNGAEDAARWLEGVAAQLRERRVQPSALIVFGMTRDRQAQQVEYWAGPNPMPATEFLGIVELGRFTYAGDPS